MKTSISPLYSVNPFRAVSLLLALAATTTVLNAGIVAVDNGQLVVDPALNVTWAADANLFETLASQSANTSTFLNTIISDSGGQVGSYALTSADFQTSTGKMDWYGAVAWVNYLNATKYLGYSTWRLPTTVNAAASQSDSPAPTSSELAELVITELGGPYGDSVVTTHNASFSLFINFQSSLYWSGTSYTNASGAWSFNTLAGEDSQDYNAKATNFFNVLPLLDGQIGATATPEPGSVLLVTTGIVGLAGFAIRRRTNR